jgi:hypothetical protein
VHGYLSLVQTVNVVLAGWFVPGLEYGRSDRLDLDIKMELRVEEGESTLHLGQVPCNSQCTDETVIAHRGLPFCVVALRKPGGV